MGFKNTLSKMEIPKEIRDKFKQLPDKSDEREQKKKSRLMFRKRKLDKEVRQYIKDRNVIKYGAINEIGNRHGFRLYDLGPSPERDG